MTSAPSEKTSYLELFARLCYFTDMFVHRRVLVVSDSEQTAGFLAKLNARYVCSISESNAENSAASAKGQRGPVEFKNVQFDNLNFRDGMFDVAVVPNLEAVPNATALLNELRRVVGRRGHVIAASPNPMCESPLQPLPNQSSSVDYYQLYDVLSQSFDSVQMIGQAPFLGYAVSDLTAPEDTEISFDGSLLENNAEEIEWFIAVCGEEAVALDGYAIIQIPLLELGLSGSQNNEIIEQLESENQQLLGQKDTLLKETEQLEQDLRLLEDDMRSLSAVGESAPSQEEIDDLKTQLHAVKLEMGTRGVKVETLENDLEKERLEAEAARARAVQLAKQFDDERKAAQARQIEQQMVLRSPGPDVQAELSELKGKLKQAESNIAATEQARDEIIEQTQNDALALERLRKLVKELQKKEIEFVKREDVISDKLATAHLELRKALALADEANRAEELEQALARAMSKEKEMAAANEGIRAQLKEAQEKLDAQVQVSSMDADAYAVGNERLEKRLKELANTLSVAQAELERREALVRDLTVAISVHKSKSNDAIDIEKKLRQEQQKIDDLVVQLAQRTEELTSRDKHILSLVNQVDRAAKEEELSVQKEARLLAQVEYAAQDKALLVQKESQLGAALQQTEQNSALLIEKDAQIMQLRQQVEQAAAMPAVSPEEIANRDMRIARLEGDLQASVWRSEELEARNTAAQKSLGETSATLLATEAQIAQLDEALQDATRKQQEIVVETEQVKGLTEKNEVLELELAKALGAISGQHRARVEAELTLSTVEQKHQSVAKELDDAIVQTRTLEEELAAAMGAISGQHRARVEAELELTVLQTRLLRSREELDAFIVKSNEMEDLLAETKGLLFGHRRARMEAELAVSSIRTENQALCERLDVSHERIKSLEFEIANAEELGGFKHQGRIEAELGLVLLKKEYQALLSSNAVLQMSLKKAQKVGRAQAHQSEDISQLAVQLEQSHEEIEQLRDELTDAGSVCSGLEQQVAVKKEELSRLQLQLTNQEKQNGWLKTELSSAENENAQLQRYLKEQTSSREQLQHVLDAVVTQKEELQHSTNELVRNRDELHGVLNASADEADRLRHDLGGADAEIHRLRDEVGGAHGEMDRLRQDLGGADAEIHRLRDQLGGSHGEVERLRHEDAQSRSEIHHLHEQLGDSHRELEHLKSSLGGIDSELSKVRSELDSSQSELARSQVEVDKFTGDLEVSSSRVLALSEELGGSKVETERLRNELAGRADEVTILRNERDAFKAEVNQLEQQGGTASAEISDLQNQLGMSGEEIDRLRHDLSDGNTELTQIRQELMSKQAEVDSTRVDLAEQREDNDKLGVEMAALQERLVRDDNALQENVGTLELMTKDLTDRLKLEQERTRDAGADAAKWAGKAEEMGLIAQTARAEIDVLNKENDSATHALKILREDLTNIEKVANAAAIQIDEDEYNATQKDLEQVRAVVNTQSTKLQEVASERDSAKQALEVIRQDLQAKEQAIASLADSSELDDIQAQLHGVTDVMKSQTAQLDELSKQLIQKDGAIESLLQNVQQLESEVKSVDEEAEHQLLETQKELESANLEYHDLQQKTEILQERLGQKEVQLSDTISRLETVTEEVDGSDELKNLLDQKDEELRSAKEEISDMQMEFAAKNLEISQAKGNSKAAKERVERLSRELEVAKAAVPEGMPSDVLEQLADLKRKSGKQDETISELEGLTQESQPLITSLTDQLEQRERHCTKLEKKIRMLNTQLKETEGDAVAWDMELKFRDAKISALEEEVDEIRQRLK